MFCVTEQKSLNHPDRSRIYLRTYKCIDRINIQVRTSVRKYVSRYLLFVRSIRTYLRTFLHTSELYLEPDETFIFCRENINTHSQTCLINFQSGHQLWSKDHSWDNSNNNVVIILHILQLVTDLVDMIILLAKNYVYVTNYSIVTISTLHTFN